MFIIVLEHIDMFSSGEGACRGEEERKQREEVGRLVEERRKLRDEKKLRHRNAANLLLSVKEKIIKETKRSVRRKGKSERDKPFK
ncbi:hypothetical protein YC2023_031195 [Brassica napus]